VSGGLDASLPVAADASGAKERAATAVGFGRAALHLGGLWGLAFAQPLFGLLADSPEFFVARGNTRFDIVVLAFAYGLVPPLVGAAAVWAAGRLRPALGRGLLLTLIGLLVAAFLLPPLGDALAGSVVAVAVALALGAAAALAYAKAPAVRTFLTVLSPAPLVFVCLFLLISPVSELVLPSSASASVPGPSRSSTPIVLIVLDELPVATLMDGGRLDARSFPHLARFAEDATWYRNATTGAIDTPEAVPSILTGVQPRTNSLPTASDQPRSLFTLFRRSHEPRVVEPITDLCPADLCPESRPAVRVRMRALARDLGVVVEHLLAPDDLRDGLPAVDRVWVGFDGDTAEPGDERTVRRDRWRRANAQLGRIEEHDTPAMFERLAAALGRPSARPPLVFMHSELPHVPWRYLPDGRRYARHRGDLPGIGTRWTGRQWLVDQAFQRHFLQMQYTDRLVGRLFDTLRARGLYDKAVIVVTSDHGTAFRAGEPRRQPTDANWADIASVPLIVKRPDQRAGAVEDAPVRTVDVLPTIAKAAGVDVPWRTDGRPADERTGGPSTPIPLDIQGVRKGEQPLATVLAARAARERHERVLLRHGVYAIGPRPDLLGRPAGTARAAAGLSATVDAPDDFRAIGDDDAVLPVLASGAVAGLAEDAVIAVAVDGRVAATTRVYRNGDELEYSALLPPAALRPGSHSVTVLQVLPGDALRRIGTASAR
jgi:arylsulfatase A-like enzyme